MFIAGACSSATQNQVSKLIGNAFVRMNDLPVKIHHAICGSFNQTGIVCGSTNCYSVSIDGVTGTLPVTTYSHQYGGVVGFQDNGIIFGGSPTSSYHTEQYKPETNSWTVVNSVNAFGESSYYRFSAVASEIAIYSFGGTYHANQIYIMNTDFVWNLHPQTLRGGRDSHKAMINGKFDCFVKLNMIFKKLRLDIILKVFHNAIEIGIRGLILFFNEPSILYLVLVDEHMHETFFDVHFFRCSFFFLFYSIVYSGNLFFMFGGNGEPKIEVLHLNSDNTFNITEYDPLDNYYNYPFAFKVTEDDYLS